MRTLSLSILFFGISTATVHAESKMYTAATSLKEPNHSVVIRSVDDAKRVKNEYYSSEDMRARPIFEELNQDPRDTINPENKNTARVMPELLRPFDKK